LAILIGAVALAVAGSAHAQSKPRTVTDFTIRADAASQLDPNAGRSVKWDARRGRFGVTLDLEQPGTRDAKLNDIQAGAYFRLTPSLRIGGAVALGDEEDALISKTKPQKTTPRVRLETAFKF
jgi:hypothetical protein